MSAEIISKMNLNVIMVIELCLFMHVSSECGLSGSFLRRFGGLLPDPFPIEKCVKFPNFR